MIQGILGTFVVLIPFLLVFKFENRLRGFLYVSILSISFHVLVGVATQASHIFMYPVVLSLDGAAAAACLLFFIKDPPKKWKFKIQWLAVGAFVLIFLELFSVHYSYTGVINDIQGGNQAISQVSKSSYSYPYYSDEWIGVSLVEYSIKEHALPLVNPLEADRPFPTDLAVFYSSVAEVILLFNLNPLTQWSLLALINGMLICLFVYVFLRTNKASPFAAVVAALSVPLIVNGTNMPGIWFLTPFIGTMGVFMLGLAAASLGEDALAMTAAFVSFMLYPPIIIFSLPTTAVFILGKKGNRKALWEKAFSALGILTGSILIVFIILASKFGIGHTFVIFVSAIIRKSLDNGIPVFLPWNIMPIAILFLACIGYYEAWRRKLYILLVPITVGIALWILYAFIQHVVLVEYSRVVPITALLSMPLAGLGLDFVIRSLKDSKASLGRRPILIFSGIIVMLCFVLASISYTEDTTWIKSGINTQTPAGMVYLEPSAPVNHFLQPDDLRLFRGITEKRFIALPWKGLVIGVATRNYPLQSKQSTITNDILSYSDFLTADCSEKVGLAERYSIDFAYSTSFQCPFFEEAGESSEGFYLYRFIGPKDILY